jgi:hypothetical protein
MLLYASKMFRSRAWIVTKKVGIDVFYSRDDLGLIFIVRVGLGVVCNNESLSATDCCWCVWWFLSSVYTVAKT